MQTTETQRETERVERPVGAITEALEGLRPQLRGELITPADAAYDEARRVYNAMIDRHPRAIVRCRDVADVLAAVAFAREHGQLIAVRGGGHSGAGLGSCDGGVVIDLSPMRGVIVDPEARTARVQGGCTWGDVDHATHPFGLATVSGVISTTGVGGLTLGGGHGHLSRMYGLTIDNLLSADVVLADGRRVRASPDQHPDLFWALRGGGGNFGVVTSFEYRLHPVSMVYAGPTLWDIADAERVMRWYRDFLPSAPEEVNGFFALMQVPAAEPFPEALHDRKVAAVIWCCVAEPERAAELIAARADAPTPLFEHLGPMPYPALQSAFDRFYPPGHQWYWRGDFVRELGDEAIEQHAAYGRRLPSALSSMHLYPIDGAVHRVAEDATAFAYRQAQFSEVIVGVDPDPAEADTITRWCKDYWNAVHPFSEGGAYVNFLMEEGEDRIRATYRGNYDRLVEVKSTYDPDNLFRLNQNIAPSH